MTPELINWLLLALFVGAFVAVFVARRNRYPRFIFNVWAIFLYVLLLPALFLLGWLLALLLPATPDNARYTSNMFGLILLGLGATLIALLMTLVLRWAVNTDLLEPPKD